MVLPGGIRCGGQRIAPRLIVDGIAASNTMEMDVEHPVD